VEIRWHYYDARGDLYWYLDNVRVSYLEPGSCASNLCMSVEPPEEVSPPLSSLPLLIAKNPAQCPDGVCMYFSPEPVASGYNVYEGSLGSWYSHDGAPGNACDVAVSLIPEGWLQWSFAPSAGSSYYLATAFNAAGEGTAGNPAADAQSSCPP
jgi:hypothetical protein